MKRLLPLAALAAALTVPQVAGAATFCVSKPECVSAGGTASPDLTTALSDAANASPGPDRIEIGPGDFSAAGGFSYVGKANEGIDVVGSGRGVTRILDPSTANAGSTVKLSAQSESSVSDLSIVAPTPSGNMPVAWGLVTSATVRRVDVSGVSNYIAVQLNPGGKIEDSTIHGSAPYEAIGTNGTVSISDSSIESDGAPIGVTTGEADLSRIRIDARSGPRVSGGGTLALTDSLILTHGGPGLRTSYGGGTTVQATGDTVVGDDSGSAAILAGEGGASHNTHVTVSNSILTGYGHSVIANQDGGGVDVKLSHSDYDDTTVLASVGQVDESDANLHLPGGFGNSFHLAAGSPLIDAGDPSTASSSDLDGGARSLDGNGDGTATPDIGAFEFPAPASPAPPTDPGTQSDPGTPSDPTPPPVTPQDAPPVLSKLTIGKRRIARGRRTSFGFEVSESSRVRITLKRRRHVKGALVRAAHAGRNKVAFRGRIGRRALKPGRYVAVARATDSAGQRSARQTLRFTLLAPRPRAR